MNNNQFEIFENYTDDVCRYILSKRKKNEIKEEIYSHLLEEYDRNFALGLSHEDAQEKAISKMGDKNVIANQFGMLYAISPVEYMRSSLILISLGFLFTTFHINLFVDLHEITNFIGEMLLMYGLFKLRKTDKKLKFALYLDIFLNFYAVATNTFSMASDDTTSFNFAISIVGVILHTVLYIAIFTGINSLCKTLEIKDKKRPKMMLATVAYVLLSVTVTFASLISDTDLPIFVSLFVLIYYLIIIFQLINARKTLSNNDDEFDLKETISKSEKVVYWVLILSLVITPLISMYAISTEKPETSAYSINDIENSENSKAIREKLLELGFPKEYLDDFPDSEILQYENAIYIQALDEGFHHTPNLSFDYQYVLVYLPQDEVRAIIRVELDDKSDFKYRKGLYLRFTDKYFIGDNGNRNFYLSLYDNQGETFKSEPFSTFSNEIHYNVAGFEFQYPEECRNRRAYVCKTATITQPTSTFNTGMYGAFIYQKMPFALNWQSINDKAKTSLVDYTYYSSNQLSYNQLSPILHYMPEYSNNVEYNDEEN